jgi:hypothetical protein
MSEQDYLELMDEIKDLERQGFLTTDETINSECSICQS